LAATRFTAASPPATATIGIPYSYTFAAEGVGPLTFTARSGNGFTVLPAGLSLDRTTGVVSGTPTLPGTYNFVVRVENAFGGTDTDLLTIDVPAASGLVVSVATPAEGAALLSGAMPNLDFACSAAPGKALQAGVAGCGASVDGGAAVASGTPLASAVGAHTVVVTATQTDGQTTSVTRHYTVVASVSVSVTAPLNDATYLFGELPNLAFTCTPAAGAALAAGLAGCSASIDGGAPVASGAALAEALGPHTVVVTATQTDGLTVSKVIDYSVTIVELLSPTDGQNFRVGSPLPNLEFRCVGFGGTLKPGQDGCYATIDHGPQVASGSPLVATIAPHVIQVFGVQTDGQVRGDQFQYFVLPAAGPSVVLTTPTPNAVYHADAMPVLDFSCTPGDGGTLKPGLEGCSASLDHGAPVADGAALPATLGQHNVGVTVTQTDGQVSVTGASYRVVGPAPTVTVTTPAEGARYPVNAVPNLDFSCAPAAGQAIFEFHGCYAKVDGVDEFLSSGATLARSIGDHTVVVTAVQTDDQSVSVTRHYTITGVPPTAVLREPSSSTPPTYSLGAVPNVDFDCSPGQGGTLKAGVAGCGASIDGGPAVADGAPLAGAVGAHTVVLTATQTDGLTVTVNGSYTVVDDTPTVTVTSPREGAEFTTAALPVLVFSCAPVAGGTLADGLAGCSASVDGGAAAAPGSNLAASVGAHSVVVTATQTNGKTSSVTRHYTVIAPPPPTVSVTTPSDGATFSFGSVPVLAFSCVAGRDGTLEASGGCSASIDGAAPVASGSALTGSVGSHSVVVTATQTDGQTASVTRGYTVTALPPTAVLTTPADGATLTAGSLPALDFACTAGGGGTLSDCSASVDGGAAVAAGAALAGSVGAHTVVVTATQTDGQHVSVTHGYTVNAAAPAAVLTTPAEGATFTIGSVPALGYSCTAGAGGALSDGLAGCSASIDGGAAVASGSALAGALGAHSVVVTATQTDGQHVSVTHGYTVSAKAAQAITFTSTAPTDARVGAPAYTVTATGGASGQPVVLSLDAASTGCALAGASVTFPHPGTCVIDADQAGTADFEAAPRVQQSFTVAKGAQAIAFTSTAPTDARVGGTPYVVAATGGPSGQPVTFSLASTSTGCSLNGTTVTFTAPGTCVIDADQAGTADYDAAPRAQQSFVVMAKQPQAITFTSTPPFKPIPGGTYTVQATGGASGNPVTFSLDPSSTGCTLNGSRVTFVAGGTCVINADQAGNGAYLPAPRVHQSFVIYGPTIPPPPVFPPPLPFPTRPG
jgi:hypothetical protein